MTLYETPKLITFAGFGFLICTNHYLILFAGVSCDSCVSATDAELKAILVALNCCRKEKWNQEKLHIDCLNAIQMISDYNNITTWRYINTIRSIYANMMH